ncbi:Peptidyl-prolyl cis-trans isomerase CYP18-1 [Bienertia sinuspersici]
MIQGGDPIGTGKGGISIWGKKFNNEIRESLKQPHLNGLYTAFGKVIHGFEVLDHIEKKKTDPRDHPLAEIRLNRATIHANPHCWLKAEHCI